MGTGAITSYIDVAQLALYLFWAFFAGLIYYLHRENKREGYPLEAELRTGRKVMSGGLVGIPAPKVYRLAHGGEVSVPRSNEVRRPLNAQPMHRWIGSPLVPMGNPMLDGVGPGAYALRADVSEKMLDGGNLLMPLRRATAFGVSGQDVDPRGLPVIGDDGVVGGRVRDVWIDGAEFIVRFLEVSVPNGAYGPHVMLPMGFARVCRDHVRVKSVLGHQLAAVPRLKNPDEITLLEEEKVMAYYGGGTLYAEPSRQEPLV